MHVALLGMTHMLPGYTVDNPWLLFFLSHLSIQLLEFILHTLFATKLITKSICLELWKAMPWIMHKTLNQIVCPCWKQGPSLQMCLNWTHKIAHKSEPPLSVKNELHQGHMYVCVFRIDWKANNQNHSSFALIMDSLKAQNTSNFK
jgi:hypothetical protein